MDRRNRKISPHQTYHDLLMGLTKKELTQIRKNINIEKVSHLNKKELVDAIENCVPRAIGNWLEKQTETTVRFVKALLENDGIVNVNIYGEDTYRFLDYFQRRGIIFYGKQHDNTIAIMPFPVLREITLEFDFNPNIGTTIEKNTELLRIIVGLLVYYGTIHIFKLIEVLENIMDIDAHDVIEILHEAKKYEEYLRMDNYSYLYFKYVHDHKELIGQQKKCDAEYYQISQNEALHAYQTFRPANNQSDNNFEQYVRRFNNEERDIVDCIFTVYMNINNGIAYWELLSHMADRFLIVDYSDLKELHNHLLSVYNHTRLWRLKGHSLLEIGEKQKFNLEHDIDSTMPILFNITKNRVVQRKNMRKVGRNDPCPCGSGRKYKYCCLKKDRK